MLRPLISALSLLLFLVLPAGLVVACGGGDDDAPAVQLQEQDRDQITRMATDYLAALRDRDMARAKAQLPAGVPDATVAKAMNTVHDQGLELVEVSDVAANGEGAKVTLQLTNGDGTAVARTLEFRIDDGQWRIWSPQLKPPA